MSVEQIFQISLITSLTVCLLQLVLAVALWRRRRLIQLQDVELVSLIDGAELLEKYSAVHQPVNISVNSLTSGVANSIGDTLIVNRKQIYQKSLFTNLELLLHVLLTLQPYRGLQSRIPQLFFYLIQMLIILLGALLHSPVLLILGIGLGILLIASSYYLGEEYRKLRTKLIEIATDLLELTDQEQALAQVFLKRQNYRYFTYSWLAILSLGKFLGIIKS